MTLIEPRQRLTQISAAQKELKTRSIHNIYPEMQEQDVKPIKKYVKTALGIKMFRRLDPTASQRIVVDGLLRTALDSRDQPEWRYDNEVIELYSDREVRFFESMNGNGFDINEGSLVQYDGADLVWTLDYNEDAIYIAEQGAYGAISQPTIPQIHKYGGRGNYMLKARQPADTNAFNFEVK